MKKKVHPEMGVGGAMKEMEKISLVEERSMNTLGNFFLLNNINYVDKII